MIGPLLNPRMANTLCFLPVFTTKQRSSFVLGFKTVHSPRIFSCLLPILPLTLSFKLSYSTALWAYLNYNISTKEFLTFFFNFSNQFCPLKSSQTWKIIHLPKLKSKKPEPRDYLKLLSSLSAFDPSADLYDLPIKLNVDSFSAFCVISRPSYSKMMRLHISFIVKVEAPEKQEELDNSAVLAQWPLLSPQLTLLCWL